MASNAELEGRAANTVTKRRRNIQAFLEWLCIWGAPEGQARTATNIQEALPIPIEAIKHWQVFLSAAEYTNTGAMRAHVWAWLQSTPLPLPAIKTWFCTEDWSELRWAAEKLPCRLLGGAGSPSPNPALLAEVSRAEKEAAACEDKQDVVKAEPARKQEASDARKSFSTRKRQIHNIARAAGVRGNTLARIREGDVFKGLEFWKFYIQADKVRNVRGRTITLWCTCKDEWNADQYLDCPVCFGRNEKMGEPLAFPISYTELQNIAKEMNTTPHGCYRRTLALRLRLTCEREPELLSGEKVLKHFGWAELDRFRSYSVDARRYDDVQLDEAERAVIRTLLRDAKEKPTVWKFVDMAEVTGRTKKLAPAKLTGGLPSRAIPTGNTATGGTLIGGSRVPVNQYKFQADAKSLHGTKVIPASVSTPSLASAPQTGKTVSTPSLASAPPAPPLKKQKAETKSSDGATTWFKGEKVDATGRIPAGKDRDPAPQEPISKCVQIPNNATRDQLRKALYDMGFSTKAWTVKCQKRNLNKQTQDFDRWELRCICKRCESAECSASYTANVKPGETTMTVRKTNGVHAKQEENRWPEGGA